MNIYKEPVTDPGKTSKKGRMTLELDEEGRYVTRTEGQGDPSKVGTGWECMQHCIALHLTHVACSSTLQYMDMDSLKCPFHWCSIITKGEARGDYRCIPKVSKQLRYMYLPEGSNQLRVSLTPFSFSV